MGYSCEHTLRHESFFKLEPLGKQTPIGVPRPMHLQKLFQKCNFTSQEWSKPSSTGDIRLLFQGLLYSMNLVTL